MGAHQILVLIALACFAVAAFFSYSENGRYGGSLVAAGLFFLTLAQLV